MRVIHTLQVVTIVHYSITQAPKCWLLTIDELLKAITTIHWHCEGSTKEINGRESVFTLLRDPARFARLPAETTISDEADRSMRRDVVLGTCWVIAVNCQQHIVCRAPQEARLFLSSGGTRDKSVDASDEQTNIYYSSGYRGLQKGCRCQPQRGWELTEESVVRGCGFVAAINIFAPTPHSVCTRSSDFIIREEMIQAHRMQPASD
ncbi:unnamed protein product [Pleuronectes platessa]|uniref:Uncharacterized protein n=1 Tax=Pleuronectes platessa TaxID=8262 RepID=A0A9N7V150_PLEPL|nr:unnamed protein product [Pleuronectes platessa]